MSEWDSWLVVLGLSLGTFLIRYSFIGLFAKRDMPTWLERGLKLLVPAIFAAIVASGVAMVGNSVAGWEHWPRYAAALLAFGVARRTKGNLLLTLITGMLTLHGLSWLQSLLGPN